jgi:hypothetical protein
VLTCRWEINTKSIDPIIGNKSYKVTEISFHLLAQRRVGGDHILTDMGVHLQQLVNVAFKHREVNPFKRST